MKQLSLLALALIILAPACSRKKPASKMLSLQKNMTTGQVRTHLGEPDAVVASCMDKKGNEIDVWEYDLGIRDEDKHNTKVMFQVGGWLLFWPLLCFPQAWRSSWSYDTYFLKFVNKLLTKWGRKTDIDSNYIHYPCSMQSQTKSVVASEQLFYSTLSSNPLYETRICLEFL